MTFLSSFRAGAETSFPEELRARLRAFPLLAGARGQEPVDCDAVAAIAVRLGDLLVAHPEIAEVEINPLRATAAGALALDARIVRGS